MSILLYNVYYGQNKEIMGYMDVFLHTSRGVLKVYPTLLDYVEINNLELLKRLKEIDTLKEKYGNLYIEEARRTYDNNIYFLISGKFILGIEYILNSNFKQSIQEFRIIEDIHGSNKIELDNFKELDAVELPSENVSD